MPRRTTRLRNVVSLVAYDRRGEKLESHQLSIEDYYDGDQPLIDEVSYRRKRKIRNVVGTIYAPDGRVGQTFDIVYDRFGRRVSGHTVFDDGTILDN